MTRTHPRWLAPVGLALITAAIGATPAPAARSRCTHLRPARQRAVLRGLDWIGNYLALPGHRSGMGSDAYGIFWEVGRTATSRRVRAVALPLARREATLLYAHLVHSRLRDRDDAFDAAFLLPDARAFGLPVEPLLGRLERALRRFRSLDPFYAFPARMLARANEDDKFNLLIDGFTLERLRVAFPGRFRRRFGLALVLRRWRDRPLVPFARDRSPNHSLFQDQAFWATHMAYVLQDYGQLRLRPSDMRVAWSYLRAQFWPLLRWGYEDLIAEFVDVFRSAGLGDRDPEVCAGTRWLLRRQRPNGYWGDGPGNVDPYDIVHPPWVAVDALRQRFFLHATPYARRERAIIRSLG